MMTLFSEKVLISNRCISGLMSNLIKKSWTDSKHKPTHHNNLNERILVWYTSKTKNKDEEQKKGNLVQRFLGHGIDLVLCLLHINIFSNFQGVPHCYFTRLNPKKMGPLQFCLSLFLGIHKIPKQIDSLNSYEGFFKATLTGHGHPGPY